MSPEPTHLIGTWRRFGKFGPSYEIIAMGAAIDASDHWMRVRVSDTDEIVDYKLSDILDDPTEH